MNIKYFILLIFSIIAFSGCNPEAKSSHPNVIIILSDDQGWGDLSFNGNSNIRTPNLDNIARSGASFDRFYVCPVCSPTRAELLTGRAHSRCGVYSTSEGGERLDLDETTLAEVFKDAGYKTAAYGKWHSGMQPPYHPIARGFDDFYGFCSGHWGDYYSPMLEHNGRLATGDGYMTDDFTNRAISFIESNRDSPFLLYLPYNTPHSPMQVPDVWWDRQKNKHLEMHYREPELEDTLFTKAALAMCENIDWNVGRLMEKLEELGLKEETIVVYFSDNGPNAIRWNGGMKGIKGHTDEGGVRAPLIIQWKGKIKGGRRVLQIASVMDLLPTLADLADIPFEPGKPLDGKSLKPLLLEEDPPWEERLIVNEWFRRISVRSQRFRLDYQGNLFDMVTDPEQTSDVSDSFPGEKVRLVKEQERWKKEVLSELPDTDLRPFPVGHPDFDFTQIPARDGKGHGNIVRSNRWPNCSYFTNWTSTDDSISWDVEVMEAGTYNAEVYYTVADENLGTVLELSFAGATISKEITEANDPPEVGPEHDRYPRMVSPVKDFKPLNMGEIFLEKGPGWLVLKSSKIPGDASIDFRLIMLTRK